MRTFLMAALLGSALASGCATTSGAEAAKHCGCGEGCTCKFEETGGKEPCTCPAPAAPAAPAADAAAPAPATP